MKFLSKKRQSPTQSQRLQLISSEAKRIRELHQSGKISARDAAKLLTELRENPLARISELKGSLTAA